MATTMASSGRPAPPPGYKVPADPPPGAVIKSEVITLSASACASLSQGLDAPGKAALATCEVVHSSYGVNHAPLPAGTRLTGSLFTDHIALAAASAGYWYWSRWDRLCSIYGCWYVSYTLTEDGIANGNNVYQWNEGCTPGGLNTSITWCGSLYNGGGYPYYAMQFGLNGQSCVILSGGTICAQHGIRRWIDDWGNAGGYSVW
ncbi:MAG: hypothetical protein ACYDA0_09145 [Candidatus Dormibacteraceae bacterium]